MTDQSRRRFTQGATSTLITIAAGAAGTAPTPAFAQSKQESGQRPPISDRDDQTFTESEIAMAASDFFGTTAQAMAEAVHKIFAEQGQPNAYIRGEEAGGAFIVGLRYGVGNLVMKRGDQAKVYWQGPSAGWDIGGDAVKAFTLVYRLPNVEAIYQRFPGVEGTAYFIGGVGINYQQRGDIVLAPMRAGVGFRLGANVGYLKYSREREWLPF